MGTRGKGGYKGEKWVQGEKVGTRGKGGYKGERWVQGGKARYKGGRLDRGSLFQRDESGEGVNLGEGHEIHFKETSLEGGVLGAVVLEIFEQKRGAVLNLLCFHEHRDNLGYIHIYVYILCIYIYIYI